MNELVKVFCASIAFLLLSSGLCFSQENESIDYDSLLEAIEGGLVISEWKNDTILDLSKYQSFLEEGDVILKLMLKKKYNRIQSKLSSKWGNEKLFRELVDIISDSLRRFGMPVKSQIMIVKTFLPTANVISVHYCLNDSKSLDSNSLMVELSFWESKGIGGFFWLHTWNHYKKEKTIYTNPPPR